MAYTRTYDAAPFSASKLMIQRPMGGIDRGADPRFIAILEGLGINPSTYWRDGPMPHLPEMKGQIGGTTTPTTSPPATGTTPAPTPTTGTSSPFDQRLSSARARAEQEAELYLRSQGLNRDQYMPLIQQEFNRLSGNLLPTDDPASAFSANIVAAVIQGEQAKQRNQFLNEVGQRFGAGHENSALPSTLLDDAINSILTEQKANAAQYLERGKARGIYNDVGYNAGLAAINNAASVGRSDLSTLGASVIDRYRGQLDEIGDKAFSAASGYELGGPTFSLDPYISQYNDVLGRATSNVGGDLRGLMGGKNYFNFSELGNRAGQAQGAVNLRDTDVATALRERRRRDAQSRGIGSQGAF